MNYLLIDVAESARVHAVSARIVAERVGPVWQFQKAANFAKSLRYKHTMIDFGSNFRKLREWAGLSQEALAMSLHVSASVVNRIENNKRKLDVQILHKLAISLQLDILVVVTVLFKGNGVLPERRIIKKRNGVAVPA